MVRRHLVKACNDLMYGPAQTKCSGVPDGQSSLARSVGTTTANSSEKYQKQLIHNQTRAGVDGVNERRVFVDIDGKDDLSVREDKPKQVPTVHRVQSYLSMAHLGRNRSREVSMVKPYHKKPVRLNTSDVTAPEPKKMELPWGFRGSDKPYVLPKFMPSFREMASVKNDRPNLVSLADPIPPSKQKWAVEWNAEPKKISIEELKEDLNKEMGWNSQSELQPSNAAELLPQENSDDLGQDHNVETPVENSDNNVIPAKTLRVVDDEVVIPEETPNSQHEWQTMRSSTNWLQNKMVNVRKKPDMFTRNWEEVYSFKETLQKGKSGNDEPNANSIAHSDKRVVEDDEQHKFHEWFKNRLSNATSTMNGRTPVKMQQEEIALREHIRREIRVDQGESLIPSNTNERLHRQDSKSSFFLWLKQRRHNFNVKNHHVNRIQSRLQKKVGDVKKQSTISQFPWSASYSKNENTAKSSQSNTAVYSNKAAVHKISLKKIKQTSRPQLSRKRNRMLTSTPKKISSSEMNKSKSLEEPPTFGYGVDSELDHVNNLRLVEHKLSSPKFGRRPWARDHPLCYWESKLGFSPRTSMAENERKWADPMAKRRNTWGGKTKLVKSEVSHSSSKSSENKQTFGIQNYRVDVWPDLRPLDVKISDTASVKKIHELPKPEVQVAKWKESVQNETKKPPTKTETPDVNMKATAGDNEITCDQKATITKSSDDIHSHIGSDFDNLGDMVDEDWSAFVGPKRNYFQDNDLVQAIGRNSLPTEASMLQ